MPSSIDLSNPSGSAQAFKEHESEFMEAAGFDKAIDDIYDDFTQSLLITKAGRSVQTYYKDNIHHSDGSSDQLASVGYGNKSLIKSVLKDYFTGAVASGYYSGLQAQTYSILQDNNNDDKFTRLKDVLGNDYYNWELDQNSNKPFSIDFFSNMLKAYAKFREDELDEKNPESTISKLNALYGDNSQSTNNGKTDKEKLAKAEDLQKILTQLRNNAGHCLEAITNYLDNTSIPEFFKNFVNRQLANLSPTGAMMTNVSTKPVDDKSPEKGNAIDVSRTLLDSQQYREADKSVDKSSLKLTEKEKIKKHIIEYPIDVMGDRLRKILNDYDYYTHGSSAKIGYADHFDSNYVTNYNYGDPTHSESSCKLFMVSGVFADPASNNYIKSTAILNMLLTGASNQIMDGVKDGKPKIKDLMDKLTSKINENLKDAGKSFKVDLNKKLQADMRAFGYLERDSVNRGRARAGKPSERFSSVFYGIHNSLTISNNNNEASSDAKNVVIAGVSFNVNDPLFLSPEGGFTFIFNEPNDTIEYEINTLHIKGPLVKKKKGSRLWHIGFNSIVKMRFEKYGPNLSLKVLFAPDSKFDWDKLNGLVGRTVYIHFNFRGKDQDNLSIGKPSPDSSSLYLSKVELCEGSFIDKTEFSAEELKAPNLNLTKRFTLTFTNLYNKLGSSNVYMTGQNFNKNGVVDKNAFQSFCSENGLLSFASYAYQGNGKKDAIDFGEGIIKSDLNKKFTKNQKFSTLLSNSNMSVSLKSLANTYSLDFTCSDFDNLAKPDNFTEVNPKLQLIPSPSFKERHVIRNTRKLDDYEYDPYFGQGLVDEFESSIYPMPSVLSGSGFRYNSFTIDRKTQKDTLLEKDFSAPTTYHRRFSNVGSVDDFNLAKSRYFSLFKNVDETNGDINSESLPIRRTSFVRQVPIKFFKGLMGSNESLQKAKPEEAKYVEVNPFKIGIFNLLKPKLRSMNSKEEVADDSISEVFDCTAVEFSDIKVNGCYNKSKPVFFVPIVDMSAFADTQKNMYESTPHTTIAGGNAQDKTGYAEAEGINNREKEDDEVLQFFPSSLVTTFSGGNVQEARKMIKDSIGCKPGTDTPKNRNYLIKDIWDIRFGNLNLREEVLRHVDCNVVFEYNGNDSYTVDQGFVEK